MHPLLILPSSPMALYPGPVKSSPPSQGGEVAMQEVESTGKGKRGLDLGVWEPVLCNLEPEWVNQR